MQILKNLKKLAYAFVFCLLSFYCITSQAYCSEIEGNENIDYWKNVYDNDNNLIGKVFDGKYDENKEDANYPTIKIYIDNLKTLENIIIKKYYFNEETKNKGYDTYFSYNANDTNEFFELHFEQKESNYYTIIIDEIEYELNYPVIGYLSPAQNQTTIDLHLKIVGYEGDKLKLDENIKDDEESGGILSTLGKILAIIAELPFLIVGAFVEMLADILQMLFIPNDDLMEMIKQQAQTNIIDRLPILDLPVNILKKLYEITNVEWVGLVGLQWEDLKFMDKVIVPAGQLDFAGMVKSNEIYKQLYDIYLIFSDAFLSLFFIKYIKRKYEKIFN